MLTSIAIAATLLSLPSQGAKLIESTDKALETGFLQGHYEEIRTIMLAPDRFLLRVRKLADLPRINQEFVVEVRAECKDPELREWCYAKLKEGSGEERSAAMRGLYRIRSKDDLPAFFAGLGHEDTERWAALALGRLKVEEAIPQLVARLGRSGAGGTGAASGPAHALMMDLKEACRSALIDIGPVALPHVLRLLHPGSDSSAVAEACKIVRRLRAGEATDRVFNVARVRLAQLQATKQPTFEQYMELQELTFTLMQFSDSRSELFEKALAGTRYRTDFGTDLEPDPDHVLKLLGEGAQNVPGLHKVIAHYPERMAAYLRANFERVHANCIVDVIDRIVRSEMNDDDQFHILELAATSAKKDARRAAAYSFAFLPRPEAKPHLLRLMVDPDPAVRRAAFQPAIELIGVPMALGR